MLDRTWSIALEKDVPWEGRYCEDISGFLLLTWNMEQNDELLTIMTSLLCVIIYKLLWLEWHYKDNAG